MEIRRALRGAKWHHRKSTYLMAIAIRFTHSWFPLMLVNSVDDLDYFIFMNKNFLLAFAVAYTVAMISACITPVVYRWFNTIFKFEFPSAVCFLKRDDFTSEESQQLVSAPKGQHIVYMRTVNNKAIQPEVQPVIMHRDRPFLDYQTSEHL